MRKIILFMLLLLPFAGMAQKSTWIQFGLNGGTAIPQDEFRENYDRIFFQGGGEVFFGIPNINTLVGIHFQRVFLNSEDFRLDTNIVLNNGITTDAVENELTSKINIFHIAARFVPFKKARFSPYLDAGAGLKFMGYESQMMAIFKNGSEEMENYKELNTALSYGFGLGFLYDVYSKNKLNVMLDLRASYYGSSAADYPKEDGIIFDRRMNPTVEMVNSKTDNLYFSVGFVIYKLNDGE